MSRFQVILTALFILFIVVGVILFASAKSNSSQGFQEIVVWGTLDSALFNEVVRNINNSAEQPISVQYYQVSESVLDKELTEALAVGEGPDAIVLTQDMILKEERKLMPIPYESLSQRDFMDTYIQGSEVFLTDNGTLALPFGIDPLMMYWNRDIFADAGAAQYPQTWEELESYIPKITKTDAAHNISQATVALGEYKNVMNAKEIISALMFQAGNPIVVRGELGVQSSLREDFGYADLPAETVLSFYTKFANPADPSYSWNRSMSDSRSAFIAEDVATYFGFASEIENIRLKNPNLNFDIAPLPQAKTAKAKTTFGTMYGLAITRASLNPANTYAILSALTDAVGATEWAKVSGFAPARRDLLAVPQADPYMSMVYQSAIVSRGWLDPSRAETDLIFQTTVENIVSGREAVFSAVSDASGEIDKLIQ